MIRCVILLIVFATTVSCAQSSGDPAADSQRTSPRAEAGDESRQIQVAESAKTKDDWTVEYEKMGSVLELSEEESTNLKAAFQSRERAFSVWMSENGARLEQLERQMFAAAKSRDLAGFKRAKTQVGPLRNELRSLLKTHQDNLQGTLSAENRRQWNAYKMAEKLLKLMEPLNLTEEQISAIRPQAVSVVQASAHEQNPKAIGYLRLEQAVESSVLTADQRQAFEAIKKKNRLRSLK